MIPQWIPKMSHLRQAYHYHPHHFTDDDDVPKDLREELSNTLRTVISSKRRDSTLDLRESLSRFQHRRQRMKVPRAVQMLQRDISKEHRRSLDLRKLSNLISFVSMSRKRTDEIEWKYSRTLRNLKEMKNKCNLENQYLRNKIILMRKQYINRCNEIARIERSVANKDKNQIVVPSLSQNDDLNIIIQRNARDDIMRAIVPEIHKEVQSCLEDETKLRENRVRNIIIANKRVSRAIASEFQKVVFETVRISLYLTTHTYIHTYTHIHTNTRITIFLRLV